MVGFTHPTVLGTVGAGVTGSAMGQFISSALQAYSCSGIDNPLTPGELRDAAGRGRVNPGLAIASGLGAGFSGAGMRLYFRPQIIKSGSSVGKDIGIGAVEGIGAGAAEIGYGAATR